MLSPEAEARIAALVAHLTEQGERIVCDADVHLTDIAAMAPALRAQYESTPHYYHGRPIGAEDALREMHAAGVAMANVWQNPAATHYPGGEDANAEVLLAANRHLFQCGLQFSERLIPSGWTDPQSCGVANAVRIAEICVQEFGFAIVKLNPAQNRYPIDSPPVMQVVDRIVELGAVPAFHYGADSPFTPASGLEAILQRYSVHPVLAVHMGGGGAGYVEAEALYRESRQLGLRYPQLRYILSARRDTHTESDLICYQQAGSPFRDNLFCASDAPYGRMSWNFGGYREMFAGFLKGAAKHPDPRLRANPSLFTEASINGYLGGNFARFFRQRCEALLARHASKVGQSGQIGAVVPPAGFALP